MSEVYKNIQEYKYKNKLPNKIEVDYEKYGLFNKELCYSIFYFNSKFIYNSQICIPYRKLINSMIGVIPTVNISLDRILKDLKNKSYIKSFDNKDLMILMGFGNDGKYQICVGHKYENNKKIKEEFDYLFNSLIKFNS